MWRLKDTVIMKQAVMRRRMKNITRINWFGPSRCRPFKVPTLRFYAKLTWLTGERTHHNPTINFKQNRSRNHGYVESSSLLPSSPPPLLSSSPPRTKLSLSVLSHTIRGMWSETRIRGQPGSSWDQRDGFTRQRIAFIRQIIASRSLIKIFSSKKDIISYI